MIDISTWVTYETKTGDPIRAGAVTVTPHNKVLTVRWPNGGWVWSRPLAITVEEGDFTHRQPVIDVTRQNLLILFGLAILFTVVGVTRR